MSDSCRLSAPASFWVVIALRSLATILALVILHPALFATNEPRQSEEPAKQPTKLSANQLDFEPNAGQLAANTRYQAQARGYRVRLERSRALIEFQPDAKKPPSGKPPVMIIKFEPPSAIEGVGKLVARTSYFPSSDPRSWVANIPAYSGVNYRGVSPGIDLAFHGNDRLEYDFLVRPGADAGRARFSLEGAETMRLDDHGDLTATVGGVPFQLLKPIAWQPATATQKRASVDAGYTIDRSSPRRPQIGFRLGSYDPARPLVIDPVLAYGFYIPGPTASPMGLDGQYHGATTIQSMTADAAGNTYIAAQIAGSGSAYNVLKFDRNGNLLATVSVGSNDIQASVAAIAVDATGNMFIAGTANTGMVTTANAYQPATVASTAPIAFLTEIKNDASALLYSTYLGGVEPVQVGGLAVDSSGNAYLEGISAGTDFPSTPGTYSLDPPEPGAPFLFIAKIATQSSGNASLVYSALIDSNLAPGAETAAGIAIDPSGDAYFLSNSPPGFPVTSGTYQFLGLEVGDAGAYVTELNPNATALVYSAFLGPGTATALAVDGIGEAYVTGTVNSAEFPTTPGSFQTSYAGGFAAKLSAGGAQLLYSTFLSGPSGYTGRNLTPQAIVIPVGCAAYCAAYVAGTTATTDLPLETPIQSGFGTFPGSTGFVTGIAANATFALFSTYLGALQSPTLSVAGLATDSAGNLYFASNIAGPDAPITSPAATLPGDGYLAQISSANSAIAIATPAALNFGSSLPVGLPTTALVELRNLGTTSIAPVFPFTFSTGEFTETDNCPANLPGGGACQIAVTITPAASGLRAATLTVASSAPNSPATVALSGYAAGEPALGASTYSVDFPDTIQAYATATQLITITNYGDTAADIAPASAGLPDFVIANHCPAQLLPQANCTIGVAFAPTRVELLSENIFIQEPGLVYIYNDPSTYSYADGLTIVLNGTGTLGPSGSGNAVLSATALNFGSNVLALPAALQYVTMTNQGIAPLSIESASIAPASGAAPGDFQLLQPGCNQYACAVVPVFPIDLAPQQTATFGVGFSASAAAQENAVLTFTDSGPGGSQSVALTALGVYTPPALVISPAAMAFPAQPVASASAPQLFLLTNTGDGAIILDRATTTGDYAVNPQKSTCEAAVLAGGSSCALAISFTPTAIGSRNGLLKIVDSLGNPQYFNLIGSGILSTGALTVSQAAVAFPAQASGTSSAAQQLTLANPGNTPITLDGIAATGDFAIQPGSPNCRDWLVLAPYMTCAFDVIFSPTLASGAETGSVVIVSAAGTQIVPLSGISLTANARLAITPSVVAFNTVRIGSTAGRDNYFKSYNMVLQNLGNEPVTITGGPTISGIASAPGSDFGIDENANYCSQYLPSGLTAPSPLLPGQSCTLGITFTPSLSGTESATFSLTGSAGQQFVTLAGVGSPIEPAVIISPATYVFAYQTVGTSTSGDYTYAPLLIENPAAVPITIASVAVTSGGSDFSLSSDQGSCAIDIPAGSSCSVFPNFAPSAAGYRSGVLTIKDSNGNAYTASLAGYGVAAVDSFAFSPQALSFPATSPGDATDATPQTLLLVNNGNDPLSVGQLTATNVILGSTPTGDFNANDACSQSTLASGHSCSVTLFFRPLAPGLKAASIRAPLTFADGVSATGMAAISGEAIAALTAATLLPTTAAFGNTTVGQTDPNSWTFTVANTGDESMTLGAALTRNLSTQSSAASDFVSPSGYCAGTYTPGQSCSFAISFAPGVTGLRSGTITIPGTFANGRSGTLLASFSGTGVAPTQSVEVDPMSSLFNAEVLGTFDTTNELFYTVTNTGTGPVVMASALVTTNFTIVADSCSGKTIAPVVANSAFNSPASCQITVAFTPLTTAAAGYLQGTLSIGDNAAGSPQTVALAGYALSIAQTLTLSQTTVSFATLPINTSSASQIVYLTDRAPYNNGTGTLPRTQIDSIQLGGINPSDFVETENCGGDLGFTLAGRTLCSFTALFAPNAGALGPRSATITITPAVGLPLIIQLTGSAAAAAQVASITPEALTFPAQTLSSTSTPQAVQIKNITSRAISIGKIVSTNLSEFAIDADPCSGTSIAPGNTCVIAVAFTPASTGPRTGMLQVNSAAGEFLRAASLAGSGVSATR